MIWIEILAAVMAAGTCGYLLGGAMQRVYMFAVKPPKALKRADEIAIMHESVIDGDALRFTVRTRSRITSFLVPREAVYQMSDDLMRAASQLGKREQPQRGPE